MYSYLDLYTWSGRGIGTQHSDTIGCFKLDLIALGVTGISRIGDSYFQNHKKMEDYEHAVASMRLPVATGMRMPLAATLA